MNKCRKFWIFAMALMGLAFILASGCKKKDDTTDAPPANNTVTDIDGNVYHTVTIGTQVWLAENLRTTKYRNGDPIPNVPGKPIWDTLKTGAYCYYANDVTNANTYGLLYNWYTVDDPRKIAPSGWHVPTNDEFTTLRKYLGGDIIAGGKLKETGTTHWQYPNGGATNETGFTALPAGFRDEYSKFSYLRQGSCFWSSTKLAYPEFACCLFVFYQDATTSWYSLDQGAGFSVRCIRD